MDWLADPGTDSRTVDIAVIRLPATVPVTDPRYGGPILLNPGGPGGSGVRLALGGGKSIRTILSGSSSINSSSPTFTSAGSNYITDDETEKHFDVISFDPRGVNNTRPFFACFPDSTQNIISELEDLATGVYGSSDTAFDTHWAKARALASDCSKRAMDSGIGEHMATASVARDIIEIVERHGEWREKEVQNYLQTLSPAHPSRFRSGAQEILVEKDVRDLINRTRYMPNEEKVQYWGFSYGTILGATLAAMFPERMERIVLDGVADSFDYMRGGWLTNLQDTDMQLVKFGEYCWVGGPKNCALYHEDGPAVILETFMGVVQSLKKTPLSVPGTGHSAAGVATYSDLKDLFFSKTYKPLQNFHNMSIIMKELSQGNGTGLMQAKLEKRKVLEKGLSEQCIKDGPYMPSCFNSTAGYDMSVGSGILCTDAEPQTNVTKEEYWDYVQELMGQSVLLGDSWGTIRAPCTQVSKVSRHMDIYPQPHSLLSLPLSLSLPLPLPLHLPLHLPLPLPLPLLLLLPLLSSLSSSLS